MAYRKIRTRIRISPRVLVAGAVTFVACISAWLWTPAPAEPERRPSTGTALPLQQVRRSLPTAVQPARMVYRNSVLPGGVASAAELSSALARDPVAAAHYSGFNVAAAHAVRVERSRMVHVSYRIGDQIYWTRKPVRLALGETLLSDGEHLARARCGNRISEQAQAPVLLNEPAPEVLEAAFISADALTDAPPDMAPRVTEAAGAAAQPADAQQATSMHSAPAFAFTPVAGMWSSPAADAPTRILALSTPPVSGIGVGIGGDSGPVREPPPPGAPTTAPRPGTPGAPSPKPVPPVSPPATSPPPDSPMPMPTPTPAPTPAPAPAPPQQIPPPQLPPPITPEFGPGPRLPVPRAPTPVPEPGSAALFGIGLAIFLRMRSRGQRNGIAHHS